MEFAPLANLAKSTNPFCPTGQGASLEVLGRSMEECAGEVPVIAGAVLRGLGAWPRVPGRRCREPADLGTWHVVGVEGQEGGCDWAFHS